MARVDEQGELQGQVPLCPGWMTGASINSFVPSVHVVSALGLSVVFYSDAAVGFWLFKMELFLTWTHKACIHVCMHQTVPAPSLLSSLLLSKTPGAARRWAYLNKCLLQFDVDVLADERLRVGVGTSGCNSGNIYIFIWIEFAFPQSPNWHELFVLDKILSPWAEMQ